MYVSGISYGLCRLKPLFTKCNINAFILHIATYLNTPQKVNLVFFGELIYIISKDLGYQENAKVLEQNLNFMYNGIWKAD